MNESKSLTVEHVFDATPQELWDAWTDPEQYKAWYNPAPGMELVIHAFDVRVGGAIHFDMPMPGGRAAPGTKGIFHVVEPLKRLVFGAKDKSDLNEVTFRAEGKRTRLIVTWSSTNPQMASPDMQRMAVMAWKSSAAKLEAMLRT